MWNRLSEYYEVKLQPNGIDKYMDTPDVLIYDNKAGFVKNYRVIKNHNSDWLNITFSNGRTITCTPDHPFETENRGVVQAKDLTKEDEIKIDTSSSFIDDSGISVDTDKAWFYGFMLCDGAYYDSITASIALNNEDDIKDKFVDVVENKYHLHANVVERFRGAKGNYKDLNVANNKEILDDDFTTQDMKIRLISLFEGKNKINRHIPNEVFTWNYECRLAFLAGMIDADGYINNTLKQTAIQIGSTNKELAIQQMILAQTLNMPAYIYKNHYISTDKTKIRYRVEFVPTNDLINVIVCQKKTNRDIYTEKTNKSIRDSGVIRLSSLESFIKQGFSYDVTTESEHFTVSGIYSHNCRSFLTPDRFTDVGIGNIANALNYKPNKHKYYGRSTILGCH